jgi:hypothetical protein
MNRSGWLRGVALLLCIGASAPALAATACEEEVRWVGDGATRHFVVLAGRSNVFYDSSGPAFVMLIKTTRDTADVGAIGIYAGADRHTAFGVVPTAAYEEFLREPRGASDVMLRLEVKGPQYERVLQVLKTWERRVREQALLYRAPAMNNILVVKAATEELNRCGQTLALYRLDWGLEDDISENNLAARIPFEYFKELKQLNAAKHVPDSQMPAALLATTQVAATQVVTNRRRHRETEQVKE